MNKIKALGVIPARYGSSRFPGKPLALLRNKPMIQWVCEGARQSKRLDHLVVATDDERIFKTVEAFGGSVMMTDPNHPNGTSRVYEAAKRYDFPVVVNIQGDEPLITGDAIDALIEPMEDESVQIATLCAPVGSDSEWENPNVVKVVRDQSGRALYFSRAKIPYIREASELTIKRAMKHIGIYAYRLNILDRILRMKQGLLESAEKLEQLRWLENGVSIYVFETSAVFHGVDSPEDLNEVLKIAGKMQSRSSETALK